VRLISSKVLPDSYSFVLKMLIPDSGAIHTVRAAGTVKWSHIVDGPHKKYYEMGIEFTDIAAHDIDILQRLWQQYA
jgi:hypothetical protein